MSEARVGAFEAKTHLSALLERVERGESITITRHGRPVARLVPAPLTSVRRSAISFPPTQEELTEYMRRWEDHAARVQAEGAGLTPEEAVALVREHRDR